jgi:DNA-binding transcriptional MerR regulator
MKSPLKGHKDNENAAPARRTGGLRSTNRSRAQPRASTPPSAKRMTIEELAARTGLTVRHLRELQTKNVLEPPELEGRKGFYNERHEARVALVRRLQDRGYSLVAIADLVSRWREGAGTGAVFGLEDAIQQSPPEEHDRELSDAEVRALIPEFAGDPSLTERAIAANLVRRQGDGLVAPSAQLLELGRLFLDSGMSVDGMFLQFNELRADCQRLAQRFRENFMREIFAPMQAAGLPADRLAELSRAIVTLRPAAVRAVTLLMTQAMYGTTTPVASAPVPQASTRSSRAEPRASRSQAKPARPKGSRGAEKRASHTPRGTGVR